MNLTSSSRISPRSFVQDSIKVVKKLVERGSVHKTIPHTLDKTFQLQQISVHHSCTNLLSTISFGEVNRVKKEIFQPAPILTGLCLLSGSSYFVEWSDGGGPVLAHPLSTLKSTIGLLSFYVGHPWLSNR